VSRATATAAWGGVLCRPGPAVLSAQERNRDVVRPHLPPRSVTPRAAQGSFTSRFRLSVVGVDVGRHSCQIAGRRAVRKRT
jgi:hypothetical protein